MSTSTSKRTGKPCTVKLTDDDVIAIVEGLNLYECRPRTARDGGITALLVLRPLVSRYDEIMLVRRAELRSAYLAAQTRMRMIHAHGTLAGDSRQAIESADKLAALLGHVALKQGVSYECSRCGASGRAEADLNGPVFHLRCGQPKDASS